MYSLLRRLLFLLPAETAHYLSMNALRTICSLAPLRRLIAAQFTVQDKKLERRFFGLSFRNPVGLGAGFDKNARYLRELDTLGFGFVEIGTVTPRPQEGNEKPRLFRLPKDSALINRMGFNNDGVEVIAARLKSWRKKENRRTADGHFLIGGNIGKNKVTPNEDAWKDYEICFRALHPYVDFFVVNVSSPNTPGLRALQEKDALKKILSHLQELDAAMEVHRPILLKIAPDLTSEQLDDVVALAQEIRLAGIVATNTTIARTGLRTAREEVDAIGAGGLSGAPVRARATEVVRYLHQRTGGLVPVIASGGIFTGADAKEKMEAGGSLVEVWTGFIYEGPAIVKRICRSLSKT